jgi:hypothetical protein
MQDDDRYLAFRASLVAFVRGYISTSRAQRRRFSFPSISSARTRSFLPPISTAASGLAFRLSHQTGSPLVPPFEATVA